MRKLMTPLCLMIATFVMLAMPGFAESTLATHTLHPLGFPTPIGPVAQEATWLYNVIFIITVAIVFLVGLPILYILWKFRRDKVKKPATFSHHMGLELLWTLGPAVICFFIAFMSYKGMILMRTMPEDAMNVEAVAYQFSWDFFYPDYSEGDTHVAVPEATGDDAEISLPGAPRQTKELIVPVGRKVVLHVTASDVLHAFWVPHLGVKIDAIPGRINYSWFEATEPGSYLGQCAELCGQAHSEMFFRVKAVPQAEFDAFIAKQRVAAGLTATPTVVVSGTTVSTTVVSGTAAVSVTSPDVVSASAVANVVASATGVISRSHVVKTTPHQNPGPESLTSNTTLGNGVPNEPEKPDADETEAPETE